MAQNLYCSFSKEILSLDNTVKEIRKGVASVLIVRCIKCLSKTSAPTGKAHEGTSGSSKQFDTNSKAILGKYFLLCA